MSLRLLDGFSVEDKILVYCGNVVLDRETTIEFRKLISGDINWDYLLEVSRRHGIIGLVGRHILGSSSMDKNGTPGSVPNDVLTRFRDVSRIIWIRNKLVYKELERILKAFNSRDIPVVVLKGPVLTKLIYERDDLRTFGDLDILIRCEDKPQAHELMPMLGYVQGDVDASGKIGLPDPDDLLLLERMAVHVYPYVRLDRRLGWLAVELHIPHKFVEWGLNMDLLPRMMARAVPITICNAQALTLCPLDLLIFACSHYFRHAFWTLQPSMFCTLTAAGVPPPALKHTYDIVWILHKIRPRYSELLKRVVETQTEVPVYFALSRINLLYPKMIPDLFLKGLASKSGLKAWSKNLQQLTASEWSFGEYKSCFLHRLINPARELKRIRQMCKNLSIEKSVEGRLVCPKVTMQSNQKANLKEWNPLTHGFAQFEIRESQVSRWNYFNTHLAFGVPPDSDDDCSAQFWIAWNEEYFYLIAEVRDDVVEFCENIGKKPLLSQDALYLVFSVDEPQITIREFYIECTPLGNSARIFARDSERNTWESLAKNKTQWAATSSGYCLKTAIPWTAIGVQPRRGAVIGFDAVIVDVDHKSTGRVQRTLSWSGSTTEIWADRSWTFPELLGELVLA